MEVAGLIVGLGNPGKEYELTRHNFGFIVLDALEDYYAAQATVNILSGKNDPYTLWRTNITDTKGNRSLWLFLKPLTYMNRSGTAVQHISAYYHVEPENILVLHDELDLPLGKMRFKRGGGNAGHNGLKSIQQCLGTPDFARLRLGTGKPAGFDTVSFVLGRFSPDEQKLVTPVCKAAMEGVFNFMNHDDRQTQQFCNSYSAL